jgi:hypothetical protein
MFLSEKHVSDQRRLPLDCDLSRKCFCVACQNEKVRREKQSRGVLNQKTRALRRERDGSRFTTPL